MSTNKRAKSGRGKHDDRLFTLEVHIIRGPMTDAFVEKNKVVCRTVEIRGGQTLENLHHAIFDAFDREDEHMYEFQIGGKGPMDPEAKRYVLPMAMDGPFGEDDAAGTVRAAVGALGLKKDDVFGYWFDFGDDWWHQINVIGIEEKSERGKYPKVTKRVGESPPQYADWDETD